MRLRQAGRLPKWQEQGAPVLRDVRQDDISQDLASITRPIYLEVGCGKGGFIAQMAARHKDAFFIGVDKVSIVIAKAAAKAIEHELDNVLFINGDIEEIAAKLSGKQVERIFLNFSDPWPRRRNHIRRLTAPQKLECYETLLAPGGVIEQKTDNSELFEWSVTAFQAAGWQLMRVERGFAPGEPDDGSISSQFVQTEYEQKFRAQGIPINYLRAAAPQR
ncbi:tRNA (guanosine(46)-N7)-methyltransferase TrmB [Alicyclobacillus fodiniaquatilis]|uniref:tRNA (guanine-N(7)-)-methyltransferase n=1 Tax=Alicyclobacillus fodiniaquatilis TaxID=1661150 RepID=A0ABW4JCR5_9BACL